MCKNLRLAPIGLSLRVQASVRKKSMQGPHAGAPSGSCKQIITPGPQALLLALSHPFPCWLAASPRFWNSSHTVLPKEVLVLYSCFWAHCSSSRKHALIPCDRSGAAMNHHHRSGTLVLCTDLSHSLSMVLPISAILLGLKCLGALHPACRTVNYSGLVHKKYLLNELKKRMSKGNEN